MLSLTTEEKAAIRTLERLAKRWPKTLWLYSASGSLHVMRCGPQGEHVETPMGGSDPTYRITKINIPNDGGDW